VSKDHEIAGVGEAIVKVADDAKAYAAAQMALYKAIALARWRMARTGLAFGAVAAVLSLAAIIALLVGLILSLSPHIGPLGATTIVVGAALILTALLGWLAGRRLANAFGSVE
jgi:hypothetical protein